MKAIILAAGEAKRLGPVAENKPKCLLKIGQRTIIDYQIQALVKAKIEDLVIVVGYKSEILKNHVLSFYPTISMKFIYNPIYYETNTIYSLWLASSEFDDDFLYLNADVLFHREILTKLINSKFRNCLAVSLKPYEEEEVRVKVKRDFLEDIGKEIEGDGEFIGLAKFSKEFGVEFKKELDTLAPTNKNAFFELALKRLIKNLNFLNIGSLPYIEIDFPEDLTKARNEIYPKLRKI